MQFWPLHKKRQLCTYSMPIYLNKIYYLTQWFDFLDAPGIRDSKEFRFPPSTLCSINWGSLDLPQEKDQLELNPQVYICEVGEFKWMLMDDDCQSRLDAQAEKI